MADKTNELTAIRQLLGKVEPKGRIVILVVQRNFIVPEQVGAVPPSALGVGAASGRVAGPAVVHDGQGAVGRGTGAWQERVHQQAGLGHGQAGPFFWRRSVSRTTKKWASMTSVAWRCQPCQLRPS